MKASFTINGVTYPLIQVEPKEMDELIVNEKKLIAIPLYFDCKKRVWPTPTEHIEVVFYADP